MPTCSSSSIDALADAFLVHPQMDAQRLAELAADGQHRVEGGHRILKDHGDLFAADVLHLLLAQFEADPVRR